MTVTEDTLKKPKSVSNVQNIVSIVKTPTNVPFVKDQNLELHQNVNVLLNSMITVQPLVNLVPHNVPHV